MTDYSRQSFLGAKSEEIFEFVKVGVIGYGGGGSHQGQQVAHVGFGNVLVLDDDTVESSNMNRLVGAVWQDVEDQTPKVEVAKRVITGVNPRANVRVVKKKWQAVQEELRDCTVILGSVDSFLEREQLECFARRFLISYIDIGMDVHAVEGHFSINGQVILSMPGGPCMRCLHFLTDDDLKREAALYDAAGGRPQVVWPNGVLASTAIGLLVQLVTPWHPAHRLGAYLTYNGNTGTITESHRFKFAVAKPCDHFRASDVGDPYYS